MLIDEMEAIARKNRWVKVAGGWEHVDSDIHDYPFYNSIEELFECELEDQCACGGGSISGHNAMCPERS